MGTAPDGERWGGAEQAVHRFLEAAVPSLPVPADRMDRIRRRVRRRRRRAAAAAASVVTAALALAHVVGAPGAERDEPVVTAAAGPATARLLGPDRPVTVELPKGWHAVSLRDARRSPLAFVSSQPLSQPAAGGCLVGRHQMLRTCSPVSRLAEGAVLVVLWPVDEPRPQTGTDVPLGMTDADPADLCADAGADSATTGYGRARSSSAGSVDVSITVCRRGVASGTSAVALELLDRAFAGA
ncbi:hypothetical protein ABTX77_38415 [Streptomyces sp. NPDC097704]|uniref:hypothetical protein n=1 Tax=Streptomyces sp. NPDC097704 TaxID=3157101 RepID=UPI003333AF6F